MCIDSNYKNYEGDKTSCATYAGKQSANFVYKITPLVARKYFYFSVFMFPFIDFKCVFHS